MKLYYAKRSFQTNDKLCLAFIFKIIVVITKYFGALSGDIQNYNYNYLSVLQLPKKVMKI